MSLLDDVSIVVTPNGYKAGELYAVVPVPTEGAEEITNGDFATDLSGWSTSGTNATNTITWETNGARIISTGANIGLFQNTLIIGKTYRLTCDVAITVGKIGLDGATSGSTVNMVEGFNEIIFTAISTTFKIKRITGNDNCLLDNVSVKEYTAADMDVTRATAATRVDEAGLVNYAEILGSEEVTNGDFATDLSGWSLQNTSASNTIVWNNGRVEMTADGTTALLLAQTVFEVGKKYKIELDAYNITGAGFKIYDAQEVLAIQSNGNYTVYHTALSTSFNLYRYQGGLASSGEFDNISVKEVTRDNVPRIDYTGGGCPHILAEPESTNHCTFSEQPSVWTSSTGVTVTANATTSPEGTANASTVVNTATNAFVRNAFLYTSTDASLNVTTSFFLKYTNNQWVSLKPNFFTGGSNSKTWFDIQNGVLGTNDNVSSSIVDFGNGWYICSVTHQIAPATDTSGFVFIYAVDNDNSTTQVIGQGFAAFGSQGEQLSYSTSYIPTSGSTVTRNQDIFTRDGIGSLINSTEGVLFVEMAAFSDTGTVRLALSDGTNSNNIYIELGSSYISSVGRLSAVNQFALFSNQTTTDYNKIAVKFKANDFALWINGSEVSVDNSGGTYLSGTLTQLVLNRGDGNDALFGKVKQLQVYKTALTDTQLAALTS